MAERAQKKVITSSSLLSVIWPLGLNGIIVKANLAIFLTTIFMSMSALSATPLTDLVFRGSPDQIRACANPENIDIPSGQMRMMPGRSRMLPLHIAAAFRDAEVAEILIDAGAIIDATDESGWTALHVAARNGNLGGVTVLVQHGADTSLETVSGRTVVDMARDAIRDSQAIIKLLVG